MNGSEHFDPAPLPVWQADRLATLLDSLPLGISISDAERASLTWLAGFEAHTVENVAAVIRRTRARSAMLAYRETARYRGQLLDLCERAGIDPGEDPHAALLAHLRGLREPGQGASS